MSGPDKESIAEAFEPNKETRLGEWIHASVYKKRQSRRDEENKEKNVHNVNIQDGNNCNGSSFHTLTTNTDKESDITVKNESK